MKSFLSLSSILLLVSFVSLAAEEKPNENAVIHVTGTASIELNHEAVELQIVATESGASSPQIAQAALEKHFEQALAIIKSSGFEVTASELVAFSQSPIEEVDHDRRAKPTKYTLSEARNVTLKLQGKLDQRNLILVLSKFAQQKINVDKIFFPLKNSKEVDLSLTVKTLENARARADILATATGNKILRMVHRVETSLCAAMIQATFPLSATEQNGYVNVSQGRRTVECSIAVDFEMAVASQK